MHVERRGAILFIEGIRESRGKREKERHVALHVYRCHAHLPLLTKFETLTTHSACPYENYGLE